MTVFQEVELKLDVAKQYIDCVPKSKNSAQITNAFKPTESKKTQVEIDDILPHVGEFGRYQLILFFSTMPFYVFGVFVYFSQLFITEVSPQHWCWVPELENLSITERRELAIPIDENGRYGYDQCQMYSANWTEVLLNHDTLNSSWEKVPCLNGWEFNKSEIPYPTIASELGWVCDRNSYQATAQAIFFCGSVLGGFILGWLADKIGRLPVIVISNLVACVGGFITIFATDFLQFSACRFLMGMSYDNSMIMAYLLVLEFIAPRYRTLIANLSLALFYGLGAVSLPWIVLAAGHWKTICIVTSLPMLITLFAPLVLPESPRWLLAKNRTDDVIKRIMAIGKINKKEVPPKLLQEFKDNLSAKKKEEQLSVAELFKRPPLRKLFMQVCVLFMACIISFDVLVRSLGVLDFDFFISFSLVSLTEFPSLVILAFVMDLCGRRWMTAITSLIACIACILTIFLKGGIPAVTCAIIARFALNMSNTAMIQWGAELLPTPVRASGIAIIHICGSIATMISPYIVYLNHYITWMPMCICGCICGVAAIIAFALPETAKRDLPQTIDDAEKMVLNHSFWNISNTSKKEILNKNGKDNFSFEL